MTQSFLGGRITLHAGDSREVLTGLPDASIDSVVTDPPYALVSIGKRFGKEGAAPATAGKTGAYARASAGFMGQQWDTGETAFAVEFWAQVLRVLKPGGHVVAFSGTRTYHRMVCAIEDAGFEIRDQLAWVYGSGFPKSHDVAKGIDAKLIAGSARTEDMRRIAMGDGYEPSGRGRANFDHGGGSAMNGTAGKSPITEEARAWAGWGTALKPAWEPIVLARKSLQGTVAANVIAHGTGAVNIDGCRVGLDDADRAATERKNAHGKFGSAPRGQGTVYGADHRPQSDYSAAAGRWPANIVHDGSDEVVAAFPDVGKSTGGQASLGAFRDGAVFGKGHNEVEKRDPGFGDSGSAARFFYSAKADADDRIGSKHPTVKPVDLMQWLCRLVTPPGGVVLDPFAGTGTTGEAAWREGFRAVLIEREEVYRADIARRMDLALASRATRSRESAKAKEAGKPVDLGPLFAPAEAVAS